MKICSTHSKLKKFLIYVTLKELLKFNATFSISQETAELRSSVNLKQMRQTCISGEQDF